MAIEKLSTILLLQLPILILPYNITNDGTTVYVEEMIRIGGGKDSLTVSQGKTVLKDFIKDNVDQCQSFNSTCWKTQCQSLENLLALHNIPSTQTLSQEDIISLSPALLYNSQLCYNHSTKDRHSEDDKPHHARPSSAASWGYSILFVTIINVCSLAGAMVLPFMKKDLYHKILLFMVALAVGSLAASGLLVLIPEALGLVQNPEGHEDFIWKCTTVVGGVYLFFLIERFLKILLRWRQQDEEEGQMNFEDTRVSSIKEKTPVTSNQKYKDTSNLPIPVSKSTCSTVALEDSLNNAHEEINKAQNGIHVGDIGLSHGHSHGKEPVKTVAWMIIFGDGLHNFIDGLSIGAAFTESIFAGISISVAVICEELPHELGDFAILLNAGMSVKRALFYNFLSACMCYFGLVIGILLGENTHSHTWIFAIAGGMFLYISLVDMMPEMNSGAESEDNIKRFGVWRIFVIQNVGMIIGFSVILIMSVYGGEISFE
ncbi:hypothetical protein FSP39_016428 [Pinctada imbricata]|uniref:Zinc transporter ZIP14 n=1 Tax=Pinctada imbricata TaxID=66713 RepID=A0AA88YNG8_PINIB|nr:hypothetical protein FSP39_016428 [Pinctada imbricata]